MIVGIGPAATDFHYRTILAIADARGEVLDLTMAYTDTAALLRHQVAGVLTDAEVLVPHDLDEVHAAYVAMATQCAVTEAQRACLLGGTDLALAFSRGEAPFPLLDCAAIHAATIVRAALD